MKTYRVLFLTLAAVFVLMLAGCQEGAQTASAQRRWDRVMEQARIEAAQESIDQGRLAYAKRILEDMVKSNSDFADQARQLLELVESLNQQFAAARTIDTHSTDQTVVN